MLHRSQIAVLEGADADATWLRDEYSALTRTLRRARFLPGSWKRLPQLDIRFLSVLERFERAMSRLEPRTTVQMGRLLASTWSARDALVKVIDQLRRRLGLPWPLSHQGVLAELTRRSASPRTSQAQRALGNVRAVLLQLLADAVPLLVPLVFVPLLAVDVLIAARARETSKEERFT